MQFFSKENNLIVPGTTLGEMVPDLIAFGWAVALKWSNACPLPPEPSNCLRPQPENPQVKQIHRFSQELQSVQLWDGCSGIKIWINYLQK